MRVLFVDDEPNILEGYRRQLRKAFDIEIASGGTEALEMIAKSEPFAVIVTDMQMPKMNGVEFLRQAEVVSPNSVRMMLTGNADQQTASDALNEGHIFRFLNKPCSPVTLVQALNAGVTQYRLITAEKELLEKTLLGSIGILVDVLSISDPQMFARGKKLRDYVLEVAKPLNYPNPWELEIAALLSQIGSLTIPPDLIVKERKGLPLSLKEQELLARVPESGRNLLAKIPRLENVAQIIRYQNYPYENNRIPSDQLPKGARILKILADLWDLEGTNILRSVAFRMLKSRKGHYDPEFLQRLNAFYFPEAEIVNAPNRIGFALNGLEESATKEDSSQVGQPKPGDKIAISFEELIVGDLLAENLETPDGSLLLAKGNLISEVVLERLKNYAQYKGIKEPVMVIADEMIGSTKLAA